MGPRDHEQISITGPNTREIKILPNGQPLTGVTSVDLTGVNGLTVANVRMIATVDVLATYDLDEVAGAIMRCRKIRRSYDSDLDALTQSRVWAHATTFPPIPDQPVPLVRVRAEQSALRLRITLPDAEKIPLRWIWANTLHMEGSRRWPFVNLVLRDGSDLATHPRSRQGREALSKALEAIEKELWRLLGDRSE